MDDLKRCPFCGGNAKVNARQKRFFGKNCFGTPKLSWTIYVICKKCHSRGKPITTEPIPLHCDIEGKYDTGNFWATVWNGPHTWDNKKATETFRPYVEKAILAWNRRVQNG